MVLIYAHSIGNVVKFIITMISCDLFPTTFADSNIIIHIYEVQVNMYMYERGFAFFSSLLECARASVCAFSRPCMCLRREREREREREMGGG